MSILKPQYRLTQRLAHGGQGEVWEGILETDRGFRRPVAVKVVKTLDGAVRLVREAELMSAVEHPGVPQVLNLIDVDEQTWMIMERINGVRFADLPEHLAHGRRPLTADILAWLTFAACEILSAVHAARDAVGDVLHLVHGDVTPQNLMLSRTGQVRLVDFGTASTARFRNKKRVDTVEGQARFLAPEVLNEGRYDGRADIFALGRVLNALLAEASVTEPDRDALQAIIRRATHERAERRYRTASELARACEGLLPPSREELRCRLVAGLDAGERDIRRAPPSESAPREAEGDSSREKEVASPAARVRALFMAPVVSREAPPEKRSVVLSSEPLDEKRTEVHQWPLQNPSASTYILDSELRSGRRRIFEAVGDKIPQRVGFMQLVRQINGRHAGGIRMLRGFDASPSLQQEELLRVARVFRSARHANIARVFDAGWLRLSVAVIFEPLLGRSLDQILIDGQSVKLTRGLVAGVGVGVTRALQALHSLKPELQNYLRSWRLDLDTIFLTFDGELRLTCFANSPELETDGNASAEQNESQDVLIELGRVMAELALGRSFRASHGRSETARRDLLRQLRSKKSNTPLYDIISECLFPNADTLLLEELKRLERGFEGILEGEPSALWAAHLERVYSAVIESEREVWAKLMPPDDEGITQALTFEPDE